MALFVYKRYNLRSVHAGYREGPWIRVGSYNGSSKVAWTSYSFNSSTNKYSPEGTLDHVSRSRDGIVRYSVEDDGDTLIRFDLKDRDSKWDWTYTQYEKQTSESRPIYNQVRGTYRDDVIAEDGTYPNNGRHTDGYWYVKGGLAFPEFKMRIGGVLKTSENGWVKINGQLREIDAIWTKINGALREVE